MDSATRTELDRITKTIVDTIEANSIYLFGSHAKENQRADSDFDIYVVIPDNGMRPLQAMQLLNGVISRSSHRAIDVLVGNESMFNRRKDMPTIERTVCRDGVILFGQQRYEQTMA